MEQRRRLWPWIALSVAVALVVMSAEAVGGLVLLGRVGVQVWPTSSRSQTPVARSAPPLAGLPAVRADGPRLPGAKGQVAYLQTARSIVRLDLGTGQVVTTPTPDLEQFSSFIAGSGWVMFKNTDDGGGVLVRDAQPAVSLPAAFNRPGRLYPTTTGRMWLLDEEPTAGVRTAVELDVTGRQTSRAAVRLPDESGIPAWSHGAGMLLDRPDGVYRADRTGVHRTARGRLLAAAPNQLLTWTCDRGKRCDARLTKHASRASLPALHPVLLKLWGGNASEGEGSCGALSPTGRWVALDAPHDGQSATVVAVLDLRSGRVLRVPGRLTDFNPNDQTAWTANGRYLLAVTDGLVRIVDTTTGRVTTPSGLPDHVLHVTGPVVR